MEKIGRCNCNNIEIGSYDRQIWLHAPNHIPKENGYCIDLCIAQEITYLWMQGIKTHGCCCGHNKINGFIGVEEEFISKMKELGYDETNNQYGDSGYFKPKYDKML